MASGQASNKPVEADDWKDVEPNDWQDVETQSSTGPKSGSPFGHRPVNWKTTEESEHARQLHPARSAKKELVDPFMRELPTELGAVGAALGSFGGPAGGVIGAAEGGNLGTFLKRRYEGEPDSNLENLKGAAEQGAYELGGWGASKVLGKGARMVFAKYPELAKALGIADKAAPDAVGHLTAAAATKEQAGYALEPIAETIGDIEQEMVKLPPKERTVEGFLKAVNLRKDAMNAESDAAMSKIAISRTKPTGIVERLKALITPNLEMTGSGREEKKVIERAIADFEKPWSYGSLDLERMRSRARLDSFHAKDEIAQYTAKKADRSKAVDDAIEQGLKDTVYPEMDKAAGKPAGYFADLKGRQSNLITTEKILNKRIKQLGGAQAISEVTPRISKENLTFFAHPGVSAPTAIARVPNSVLFPPRELTQASKHVREAFPGPHINTLPYQVLFSNVARAQSVKGPKSKQIEQIADEYRSTPR